MSDAVESLRKEMNDPGYTRARGAGLSIIRAMNEKLILNYIRQNGPLPRVEIADELGLSRATVSSIINTLLTKGFVQEGNLLSAKTQGGKRPIEVQFKADAGYVIGVDIGRSHLTLLLRDLEAKKPDDSSPWEWSGKFDTSPGAEACLPLLASRLHDLVETSDITWDQVVGIGLAIPGTLDHDLQKLVKPPLMPNWDGTDIPTTLRRQLRLKGQTKLPIYLDNDANLGALGESRYGAGRDSENLIYIKIGTGIGAGLILKEYLYRGDKGTAGEFGHIVIDENGPLCTGCGNRGCLEILASGPAIVKDACEGISLKNTQGIEVEPPVLAGYTTDEIDINKVAQLAKDGDGASKAAIEQAGKRIGIALAGLINLLNPEKILLDGLEGGVVHAAGDLLLSPLTEYAEACSLPAVKGTPILIGELGNNAIALGAIANVLDVAFNVNGQRLGYGD